MCEDIKDLKLCLKIDETIIYEFSEKINEESIIKSAEHIEQLLIDNNAKPNKIKNVFEIIIEVMQNMLNYSYGNKELENNKKEATGSLILSYQSSEDSYCLQSCNLIEEFQKQTITDKIDSLKNLDDKALRRLSREKMRHRKDNHDKGAGLGFIMMARKTLEPIKFDFLPFKDTLLQYKLILVI